MNEYYNAGGIEVIDYLKSKLSEEEYKGFLKGNILKYLSRSLYKGNEKGDYEKAAYYANKLNELYY
jgi:hypothetical protein